MNYEILQRKFLLLDTNILIYYSKFEPFFQKFFDKLENQEVSLVIGELIKFEFLRGAAKPDEVEILRDYLKKLVKKVNLDIPQLPMSSDIITSAIDIANIYSWKLKNNKIELPDCMIAAEMKKYNSGKEDLYLATVNHDDFPNLFFTRLGIETIDTGNSIFNIGFYKFEESKYKKLLQEYRNLK